MNRVRVLLLLNCIAFVGFGTLAYKQQHLRPLRTPQESAFESKWEHLMAEMYSLHGQGKKEESLTTANTLLSIAKKKYPRLHIRHIESIHHVGWLNWDMRRLDKAEEFLDESLLRYQELGLGPNALGTHGVANEKIILADIYINTNRTPKAMRYLEEAVMELEQGLPAEQWYYESSANRLMGLYQRQSQGEKARELAARMSANLR